ncbi:MAG: flagellar type III secretion system pore protein FliP [Lachnospiraceae bacterium]|nr:flagellar type III secretion system pore protein FliP [Lachnospiraceae bacterium]
MDRFIKLKKQNFLSIFVFFVTLLLLTFICAAPKTVCASESSGLDIQADLGDLDISVSTDDSDNGLASTLQILLLLTVISLAPSILIMVTSFTRILIVLHFVRSALGMQTTPPNQVLIGLSLFLTLFIMSPVMTEVNEQALKPLAANEITTEEAFEKGLEPIRDFMFGQIRNEGDLALFCDIAGIEEVSTLEDIPTYVLIPTFIISELRIAFYIGFIIYLPFIVIDMVVSSTLMSMGMMMLPPTVISTPFKILLFIVVDGWSLVVGELVQTFW